MMVDWLYGTLKKSLFSFANGDIIETKTSHFKSFYKPLRAALCGASAKKEITGPACLLTAMNNFNSVFLTCGQRNS